ncbi:MAG: hypothetical protein U0175_27900 [Caldilineaceae bacterium]
MAHYSSFAHTHYKGAFSCRRHCRWLKNAKPGTKGSRSGGPTDPPVCRNIDVPSLAYRLQNTPQIIHIAAHTIQRSISPFFSGIQLSSEVLSVEHCYDLPLWGCGVDTERLCWRLGLESDASALCPFNLPLC